MFPFEICEIFLISSYKEHLRVTTSEFLFISINILSLNWSHSTSQPVITCSKLTIEALEQGVKHVQS